MNTARAAQYNQMMQIFPDLPAVRFAPKFFTYSAKFEDLLAGTTQSQLVNFEASSIFICRKLTGGANIDLGTGPNGTCVIAQTGIYVRITDNQGGSVFTDGEVNMWNLFGNGNFPFLKRYAHILPDAIAFRPSASLSISVRNAFSASDYSDVTIGLVGFKLFLTEDI